MRLELTTTEAAELGTALESYLGELTMEIAGTDSWDFRQALKGRKVILADVLEQVRRVRHHNEVCPAPDRGTLTG
jgi:hypothetical protein